MDRSLCGAHGPPPVYTNGFLAFTQPDEVAKLRTTVFAVDRCKQIIYKFGCSDEEYEDAWEESSDDMKIGFRIENGRLVKLHIISERVYTDSNWLFPVSHICEERLRHNGDVREDSHIEYRFGDESWENALVEENFVDRLGPLGSPPMGAFSMVNASIPSYAATAVAIRPDEP